MSLLSNCKRLFTIPYLRLIALVGVIVPRRLRADWQQEWEAELRYREGMLAEWDKLDRRNKLDLLWRSTSAFWDAIWLQQLRWEDEMIQDLRYGLRMLLKHKGFTLLSILTLALGIGANTAILSTVNGFILRPLPVEKPDNLVMPLWGSKQDAEVWGGLSYANYIDLRDQNHTLSGLLVWSMASAGVSSGPNNDNTRAEVAWGELVSGNYFDVLGVKMVIGRGFLPEEDRTQNTHPVVVISNLLWQQRFNGDAGIVGKTIYMNGYPFTVVGVAPASFKGLKFGFHQGFWAPLMMSAKLGTGGEWETERGWGRFNGLGRLKPDVTIAQAEADLNLIAERLAQQYPEKNAETKVQVVSDLDGRFYEITKFFHQAALIALCVAALVLLVACANVANLLLARAAAREKEIGIRLALGAGRWRIVRQLLTECAVLAIFGGIFGWLFAYGGTDLVHSSIPAIPFPFDLDFTPDLYVLKWTIAVSLLTVAIFGLVPALVTSRPDLVNVIKNAAARETRGKRLLNLRNTLVVAQVTISIFVLICAGLFLRSLNKAMKIDPGFSAENLVTMRLDTSRVAYEEAAGKRFYTEILRRVRAVPGVRAASVAAFLPLGDSNGDVAPLMKEGEPDPPPNQGIDVSSNWVAPRYFATLKTPLVMGRDFTERDNQDAPLVAIVNQEFARKFYGSEQNAMGKRFHFWNSKEPLREIVGVAKDGLYLNLYENSRPYIYLPEYQLYQSAMMLLISTNAASDMASVAETTRREIAQVDATMPVSGITLGEANMSLAYWGPRLSAGMASAFGLFALLLAITGLYSVMTYSVSQRTREIGIRMALGARIHNVIVLIVRQGMRLVIIGIVLGLVSAFALTRLLASLLLGVSTVDLFTFTFMTILLFAIATMACYIPARRATKVDPMTALRHE
jgi:putative ABC transport system permease protein